MRYSHAVFAVTLAFAAGATPAQIYRWTDERGRVQVSDTPPPPSARNVEKRGTSGGVRLVPDVAGEPYALQLARKNAPVTLYSTPKCDLCDQARELLNVRGVPFKEISVVNEKQLQDLKSIVGADAVPSLIVGATVQRGFEKTTYHGILDAAGYPKTGAVPPRSQKEPQVEPQETSTKTQAAEEAPRGPYAPGARRSQNK